MRIPPRCFTCHRPIGYLYDSYLDQVREEQKKRNDTSGSEGKSDETPENMALNNTLGSNSRYCCRRMFLCNKDLYDEIS